MNLYIITCWDGVECYTIQCMDIEELISELEKVAYMQHVNISTVTLSIG